MQAVLKGKITETQRENSLIESVKKLFFRKKKKIIPWRVETREEYMERILKGMKQLEEGRGQVHDIIEA